MKQLKTPWKATDRRAGYQRQEQEIITCECGARVVERFGEFHHVGACAIKNGAIPAWTKQGARNE